MVVQDFLEKMSKFEVLSYVGLDDQWDKMNFLFTVWVLMLMCTITTAKTYFLTPVICYIPNIVGSHEGQAAYITNFCYTEGTYNVPLSEFKIDNRNVNWTEQFKDRKIYYYQWLPFILGLQGIMCYLPRIIWLLASGFTTGLDLQQLLKLASEAQKNDGERRDKLVRHVSNQLRQLMDSRKLRADSRCCRRSGSCLCILYFCVKLLYISNSISQLFIMTKLLQLPSTANHRNHSFVTVTATFGWQLLMSLLSGEDWQNHEAFPRSGCCAVETRQAASSNFVFAQCALPVNMLHEKFYIFLWFWFVMLMVSNVVGFLLWIIRLAVPSCRKRPMQKLLQLADSSEVKHLENFENFENFVQILQPDGCFLIRMICINCGEFVASEISYELFRSREWIKPVRENGRAKRRGSDEKLVAFDERKEMIPISDFVVEASAPLRSDV